MIQSFRVLNVKDTQSPLESLVLYNSPTNNFKTSDKKIPCSNITKEQDNFETFLEKRK
ncbi:UNVERIFIED_CONTAM: hypothetical protein Cloal_2030 [Acetivibrio alkalicellulosi]